MSTSPPLTGETVRTITMATVAHLAGVHPSTVSLVLRGDRRVSAATRARVARTATALGYRPDPMVAALMTRRRRRSDTVRATLGYLTWSAHGDGAALPDFLAGTYDRATELGYAVDRFCVGPDGLTPERFTGVAEARGVHGLVLAPTPHRAPPPSIDWARYALVTYGYALDLPGVVRVAPDFAASMNDIIDRCRQVGHKRLGLLLDVRTDAKASHLWLAAFLAAQHLHLGIARTAPYFVTAWQPETFVKWFANERPTVLIGLHAMIERALRQLTSLPGSAGRDVQAAILNTTAERAAGGFAGTDLDRAAVGRAAIDQLDALLQRGQRGLLTTPTTVLVSTKWREGRSLGSSDTTEPAHLKSL